MDRERHQQFCRDLAVLLNHYNLVAQDPETGDPDTTLTFIPTAPYDVTDPHMVDVTVKDGVTTAVPHVTRAIPR